MTEGSQVNSESEPIVQEESVANSTQNKKESSSQISESGNNNDSDQSTPIQEVNDSPPKKDYAPLLAQALEFKQKGNELFNEQRYSEAIEQYTKSVDVMEGGHTEYAHDCSIFFGNRAACYISLGHNDDVIKDCTSALNLVPTYNKALLRRAVAYETTNQLSKALTDFDALYKIDPTLKVAIDARARLPPLVKIQQEKEAAEMIGKLKDLGNSILGKFGLSTDSFQFTKDPASGGYSMNMKK